ncbi:MAG: hypothetical protein ACKO68_01405 [Bacteroidota bacterium]
MIENDIIDLSNDIIESPTKLSLGFEPGMFSGKIVKSLPNHAKLSEIAALYSEHLLSFKGVYSTTEQTRALSEFRFKLVQLYNTESPN